MTTSAGRLDSSLVDSLATEGWGGGSLVRISFGVRRTDSDWNENCDWRRTRTEIG